MAGEVTQLGVAGLPTGFFAILDKTAGPVDKTAVDTLLAILTETQNNALIAIETVDYPYLSLGEAWERLNIRPPAFDTLTPIFTDIAQLPVIGGTIPKVASDTFTILAGDVAQTPLVVGTFAVTASDSLGNALGESSAVFVNLALTGTDTLTPVATDTAATPVVTFLALSATDTDTPVITEGASAVAEPFVASDTLTPVVTDVTTDLTQTLSNLVFERFDFLTPIVTDVITAPPTQQFFITSTDSISPSLLDEQLSDRTLTAVDAFVISLVELSQRVINELIVGSDTLTPIAGDVAQTPAVTGTVTKTATDTLAPSWGEDIGIIQFDPLAILDTEDNVVVVLTESTAIVDFGDVDFITITGGPVGFITITQD